MATERRYLKGDVVEVVEFPDPERIGQRMRVQSQRINNGVVGSNVLIEQDGELRFMRQYAHQVKLFARPWWNWLRLPFVKKVRSYQRSQAR